MRAPLALVTITVVTLALAACSGSEPSPVETPARATPSASASATPSASPAPAPRANPLRTTPLPPLTDADILSYCPDIPAVHFDGETDDVAKATVCTTVTSDRGTKESASWVNFGLEAILSAYSEPNARETSDTCTHVVKDPMIVWLTDTAGTTYPVYAPVDACGYPSAESVAAYRAAGLQILYEADLDDDPSTEP